jgi:hypothetical protein
VSTWATSAAFANAARKAVVWVSMSCNPGNNTTVWAMLMSQG